MSCRYERSPNVLTAASSPNSRLHGTPKDCFQGASTTDIISLLMNLVIFDGRDVAG